MIDDLQSGIVMEKVLCKKSISMDDYDGSIYRFMVGEYYDLDDKDYISPRGNRFFVVDGWSFVIDEFNEYFELKVM